MKVIVMIYRTHKLYEESHWVSCLRENLTSSSDGEGLETGIMAPRQSFTRQLFFKWLKQNFKIKTFLGTSKNTVMTQIWVALITMLILAYMKFLAKLGKTITQIQRLLQLNLFKRQSMWELFDPPLMKHESDSPQKMLFNLSNLQPDSSDLWIMLKK